MENNQNVENIQTINVDTEQQNNNQNKNNDKVKRRKKGFRIFFNIITSIIVIVVILEAIIGMVNMQRINNEEKPIWYLSTKTTETELKTVTEYNLGLYKIVKTDTAKQTKITLKPFFLAD